MNELRRFLEQHEGDIVWFVIPSGVIAGELQTTPIELDFVVLQDAYLRTGNFKLELGAFSNIRVDHISAWGIDIPSSV